MELHFSIVGILGCALPQQVGSLLIIALFIGNPSKRVKDRRISWRNRASLLRELTGALQIIKLLGIDISEVVQC